MSTDGEPFREILRVAVHYLHDGTPYLWHFGQKEKIQLPILSRPRVMSDASVPDCEIAHFSFEASPSPSKSVAVSDLWALSAASVATPPPHSSPIVVDTQENLTESQDPLAAFVTWHEIMHEEGEKFVDNLHGQIAALSK